MKLWRMRTSVALTNSDGEKMVKHNLLSETQAEAIPEGGVGVANISMRQNADGQNTSSATMHTGNSTKKITAIPTIQAKRSALKQVRSRH